MPLLKQRLRKKHKNTIAVLKCIINEKRSDPLFLYEQKNDRIVLKIDLSVTKQIKERLGIIWNMASPF